jgi:hypothetical protein
MLKEQEGRTLKTTPISRQGEVANCREHGTQHTAPIKSNKFTEKLSSHHFFKLESASQI